MNKIKNVITPFKAIVCLFLFFQCGLEKKQPTELITYNESGGIEKKYQLKNGLKEGLCEVYYSDGKLKGKLYFEKDKQTGKSEYYYPNGNIREVQYYEDGKRIHWDTCYFENGSFQLISQYDNGKLQGEQYKFDTNNQITHRAVFNQDTLVRFIPVEGK